MSDWIEEKVDKDIEDLTCQELDDLADEWLREYDDYYTSKSRWKRRNMLYNYETNRQVRYRRGKEIEFNRLFTTKLVELMQKNVASVEEYFDD